jgi:hypothetical protein
MQRHGKLPVELIRWLKNKQDQISRFLDHADPVKSERKYQDLMATAQQFLQLSKTFLQMANTAYRAADRMVYHGSKDKAKSRPKEFPSRRRKG